jgi:ADP-ribosyl-[dinitrogen reductase] hydrolase
MRHRNDEMILWIAVGDAAAAAAEYVDPSQHLDVILKAVRLTGYVQNPRHLDLVPGRYTDDAQMTIGVGETMIETDPFSSFEYALRFVRAFQRDPRPGYAKNFQAFLESVIDVHDFIKRIHPDSDKNGGCMRAVPTGVLRTPEEVIRAAHAQASVTHNSPEGLFSAAAVGLMSHFALYSDEGFSALYSFLNQHLEAELAEFVPNLLEPRREPVVQPARHTVHAVFYLLQYYHSLADVLRGAILIGGDTDSVGAIALGIASARMENNIPRELIEQLEPDSRYGVGFLRSLGFRLMEAHNPA